MLTENDIAAYHRDGVLVLPNVFTDEEVSALNAAFDRDGLEPGDQRIVEPQSDEVRAIYASHLRQPEYAGLVRSPRLVHPVRQLLEADLYLYQLKINAKPAHGGDGWAWHQDYAAWRVADRLPAPSLVNAVLFLDDVTETNGPISFIPGSHNAGLIRDDRSDDHRSEQHLDPDDIALGAEQRNALIAERGVITPLGSAGTVVFFHPETAHGSTPNLSSRSRRLAIATYNDCRNLPSWAGEPRAEYLVCRDTRPLRVDSELPIVGERV